MSFKRLSNRSEQWAAFLDVCADSVAGISPLHEQLATAGRFDDFLQRGVSDAGGQLISLASLNDIEWAFLRCFVDRYSSDWQTYFDPLIYVGYHQELDRRTWVPSTMPMAATDLVKPHVVVHFWAPWNMHDRDFDSKLQPVVARLQRSVAFRSINVDQPTCPDASTREDALNVPSLGFYSSGRRHRTMVGIRPSSEIEHEIRQWLDHTDAQ